MSEDTSKVFNLQVYLNLASRSNAVVWQESKSVSHSEQPTAEPVIGEKGGSAQMPGLGALSSLPKDGVDQVEAQQMKDSGSSPVKRSSEPEEDLSKVKSDSLKQAAVTFPFFSPLPAACSDELGEGSMPSKLVEVDIDFDMPSRATADADVGQIPELGGADISTLVSAGLDSPPTRDLRESKEGQKSEKSGEQSRLSANGEERLPSPARSLAPPEDNDASLKDECIQPIEVKLFSCDCDPSVIS